MQDLIDGSEGASAAAAQSASAGAAASASHTPGPQLTQEQIQSSLLAAEDVEDREAAAHVLNEMSSELREFDETMPLEVEAERDPETEGEAPGAAAASGPADGAAAPDPNIFLQQQLERLQGETIESLMRWQSRTNTRLLDRQERGP